MNDDFERPKLEPKGNAYRLVEDWWTDCKGCLPNKVCIPKGFVTDGASIPRFLWSICGDPMANPRIYAAIVHDFLYTAPHELITGNIRSVVDRKFADTLYRDYQIALGINRIKAYTEYSVLRLFGGTHWE